MSKVIFYRYNKFNNDQCKRQFPFEGKSWFVVKSIHHKRLIKSILGSPESIGDVHDMDNWEFATMEDLKGKEIYGLDFRKINAYVMGESDIIPDLEEFAPNVHTTKWRETQMSYMGYSRYEIDSLGIPYWVPVNEYQVVVR